MTKKNKQQDNETDTIFIKPWNENLDENIMLDNTPFTWNSIDIEMEEKVNHPLHYTQGSVECIDALEAATVNLTGIDAVCTANAIKYMWRWKQKGGLEDLKKAKWYIERLITRWENHEVIY